MVSTPTSIQRVYLLLLLGNTLAASLIWGINTIFLLDALVSLLLGLGFTFGTALALGQLSAIIPGLLPALALAGILAVAIALPVLALGLLASALATPPYVLWRLARLAARRRRTARAGRYSRHQIAGDGIDEFWAARGSM